MASPSCGKADEETVATAYRLLRDAVSTQAVSREYVLIVWSQRVRIHLNAQELLSRFILLCKHVREHKDAKVIGAQATSTIKQLSLLEFQVMCRICVELAMSSAAENISQFE